MNTVLASVTSGNISGVAPGAMGDTLLWIPNSFYAPSDLPSPFLIFYKTERFAVVFIIDFDDIAASG